MATKGYACLVPVYGIPVHAYDVMLCIRQLRNGNMGKLMTFQGWARLRWVGLAYVIAWHVML